MASCPQAAPVSSRDCRMGWRQNTVQGYWTSGLASLSESPQILHCSRVLNCPASWQKASKVQLETIVPQDSGSGPVGRAALCQRTDVCPQTLRKVGWLSHQSLLSSGNKIRPVSNLEEGVHGGSCWECGASWLFLGSFGTEGQGAKHISVKAKLILCSLQTT